MPDGSVGGRENGRERLLIALAFVIAAGLLRCLFLERQALWNDEMFSFNVANLPLAEMQKWMMAHDVHPPLFFYLLHGSLAFFGQSAWALRLVSAVAGSVAVGVAYDAARRLFGRLPALASGFLCLLAPFHLAYSQEGRPYALAALFCLLSVTTMLHALREGGLFWKISYAVWTVALLYTHHWGLFVLLAELVYLFADPSVPSSGRRNFALLAGVVGLCYIPGAITVAAQVQAPSPPASDWWVAPGLSMPYDVAGAFSGGLFRMASSVFSLPLPVRIAGLLSIAVLVAILLVNAFRSGGDGSMRAVCLCVAATILVPFLISFWMPRMFLWYRYPVIVFPLFCVAAGGACASLRWSRLARVAAAVLVLVGAAGTVSYFSWSKSNVREVAQFVEDATRDNVPIIIRPRSFAFLLNYYYRGGARQLDEAYLDEPLGAVVDTAASFAYVSLDVPNTIRDYMDGHFDKVVERKFPGEAHLGMIVGVYRQRPDREEKRRRE